MLQSTTNDFVAALRRWQSSAATYAVVIQVATSTVDVKMAVGPIAAIIVAATVRQNAAQFGRWT